jgi:hypothetical protein
LPESAWFCAGRRDYRLRDCNNSVSPGPAACGALSDRDRSSLFTGL